MEIFDILQIYNANLVCIHGQSRTPVPTDKLEFFLLQDRGHLIIVFPEGALIFQINIFFAMDSRRGLQMPMMMRAMPRSVKPMRG